MTQELLHKIMFCLLIFVLVIIMNTMLRPNQQPISHIKTTTEKLVIIDEEKK